MMQARVKICGLTEVQTLNTTITHGAAFVGFVFVPQSVRCITPMAAGQLLQQVPPCVSVGVFQEASMAQIVGVLNHAPLSMVQLHGAYTPKQVGEIMHATGLPVIKAINVAIADDVLQAQRYPHAAMILFDAAQAGQGEPFNAAWLQNITLPQPYFLAGGLTENNLATQWPASGAAYVDVSSGVESTRGIKDPAKIASFIARATAVQQTLS
jgi:phosphoribosylanthranilate isomerase